MADQQSSRATSPEPDPAGRRASATFQCHLEAAHAQARAAGRPCLCLAVDVVGLAGHRLRGGEELASRLLHAGRDLVAEWAASKGVPARFQGERVQVLLPGKTVADAPRIAGELLPRAKPVRVDVGDTHAWLSLGIGVAHDAEFDGVTFETLLGVANSGAEVAAAGGGSRWVHTELYDLVQVELRAHRAELVPQPRAVGIPEEARAAIPPVAAAEAPAPAVSPTPTVPPAPAPVKDDKLERRVAKLLSQLEASEARVRLLEAELAASAAGVASAYSAVQGLPADDERFEQKRALMLRILEQNLELREQLSSVRA